MPKRNLVVPLISEILKSGIDKYEFSMLYTRKKSEWVRTFIICRRCDLKFKTIFNFKKHKQKCDKYPYTDIGKDNAGT